MLNIYVYGYIHTHTLTYQHTGFFTVLNDKMRNSCLGQIAILLFLEICIWFGKFSTQINLYIL